MIDLRGNHKVSPRFYQSDLNERKVSLIDVFEDQIQGWFLDYAKKLCSHQDEHSAFAGLMICFGYFELISQYRTGVTSQYHSTKFFNKGLEEVFPELKVNNTKNIKIKEILCEDGRNGFYHIGMVKRRLFLRDSTNKFPYAYKYDSASEILYLDRERFFNAIQSNFKLYMNELRQDEKLQDNFYKLKITG